MTPDQIQLFLDGLAKLTRETDVEIDTGRGVWLRSRASGSYAAEETPLGYRLGVLDAGDDRVAVPKYFLRSDQSDDKRFREMFERSRGRIDPDLDLTGGMQGVKDVDLRHAGLPLEQGEYFADPSELNSDAREHLGMDTGVRLEVELSDEAYSFAKQVVSDGLAESVDDVLRRALDLLLSTEEMRRRAADAK